MMEVNEKRFLALDLGLTVTGVAFAEGMLFAQGFGGSPLPAIVMPKGHRRFCALVQQIIIKQRIDVLVLGLPPMVSKASVQSRSNRRKVIAIGSRVRKFFVAGEVDCSELGEIKNRLEPLDAVVNTSVLKSNGAHRVRVKVDFFDESYSTYAVKSAAKFSRWGNKGVGRRSGKMPSAHGKVKIERANPRANLDSLAALEILTAYLNQQLSSAVE